MIPLSTAKRIYEKNYTEKKKTPSGGEVRVYSPEHVAERWKKKVKKLKDIEKNIGKLRSKYKADLKSDDAKTRAVAAFVGLIDNTAIRVGNDDSVDDAETFGASTLEKKHAHVSEKKIIFKFTGKDGVAQNLTLSDGPVVAEIKKLLADKKPGDYIFEYEPGKRISAKVCNNYLKDFGITGKDIRGFFANTLIKEKLKKNKDFEKALEDTAKEIGHESKTLKNQYLDPALVKKYEDKEEKKKKASPVLSLRVFAESNYKEVLEHKIDDIFNEPADALRRRSLPNVAPTSIRKQDPNRALSNYTSTYMHLSNISVQPGQEVSRGDVIGSSGHSGPVTGPHLHIELRIGGSEVDPSAYRQEFYSNLPITSPFGNRKKVMPGPGKPIQNHEGIDIGLPDGTPVKAMADGVVSAINPNSPSAGQMIVITHYK